MLSNINFSIIMLRYCSFAQSSTAELGEQLNAITFYDYFISEYISH